MKKLWATAVLSALFHFILFPQITLKYNTHVLKWDTENSMTICDYIDPGASGSNVIWDFRDLTVVDTLVAEINAVERCRNYDEYNNANTILTEFNNRFYFKITENEIANLGYASNNLIVKYSEPIIKMKFPFTVNDYYSGNFYGSYISNSEYGTIDGIYDIEADAYGTLLLPLDLEVKNTLRIKTAKNYQQISHTGKIKNISVTIYRWYCMQNRYPLLVLIESTINTETGSQKNYQAAFNNVLKSASFINELNDFLSVYPNPFSDNLTVNYIVDVPGQVLIEVFDANGRKISTIENAFLEQGYYSKEIPIHKLHLTRGNYYLKCMINNNHQTEEIIYIK